MKFAVFLFLFLWLAFLGTDMTEPNVVLGIAAMSCAMFFFGKP